MVRVLVFRGTITSVRFVCAVRIRNLNTGAVLAARGNSTALSGNRVIRIGTLDFDGSIENAGTDLFCRVPARSAIRGIFFREGGTTDGGN